jgi:beta-lactam-binding protein with PASTA domain/serine/threonine protein kinase
VDRTVTDPLSGRVLDGRYRIGSRIARGGMATVYRATDLRLDRVVALKVMHAGLGDDDDFVGRFVREARAAARLSHPNVVGVFDQGDDDGTLFLAMEYVDGGTLRDLMREQAPLRPSMALALLDPILAALGAAHQAGLVHRDVKPENVLLADDGRVKVADFGLARAVSAETQHTTAGVLIGTVSYLSPELLVDGRADARSDVYAAGVLLYEMLTGRKPHEADSAIQVAYKHVHEDVPPPSRLVRGLPPYVDALVARATARDRDLRPADARVLLRQVRRVRAALDEGVLEDVELTSDLTPALPVRRLDDIDYVRDDLEDAPVVLTPAEATHRGPAGRFEDTSVIAGARSVATATPPGSSAPTAAPKPDPPAPQPAGRTRRSRRGPLLLVLVLLLATAAGVGAWWLGDGRYTTTPGLLNLTARSAEARLDAAGLGTEVAGRAYSETVPVGRVVSTDPDGGEHVTRNGTVSITLSQGPERHRVPQLRNLSLDRAQATLQDSRLGFGDATYVFSETVARGVVVRSEPAPGTSLRRDAAVDLVVSKGPHPVRVPDLSGKDADDASKALGKLHLRVDRSEVNSDTVEKGDVVSQSPSRGRLFRGDKVRLVVSKGPVLVDVPRVVGTNADAAEATLAAAGFSVRTEKVEYYIALGVVVKQSPGSGDRAPRGSTVTIYVV